MLAHQNPITPFYASALATAVAGGIMFLGFHPFILVSRPILMNVISQKGMETIYSNLARTFTWIQGGTE